MELICFKRKTMASVLWGKPLFSVFWSSPGNEVQVFKAKKQKTQSKINKKSAFVESLMNFADGLTQI